MHSVPLNPGPGADSRNERYRWANERSAVSPGIPQFRFVAARDVSALALWNRRCGTFGVFMDRPTSGCRPGMVAGAAARPDRLWKLAVSVSIVVCRQRPVDQSGWPDSGRPTPGERL